MPRLDWSHRGAAPLPKTPAVGDIVYPEAHPEGFPAWRVLEVPPAAGPSDTVLLVPVDAGCPVKQIRRRIRDVTNEKGTTTP